jgi:hypothetical protein
MWYCSATWSVTEEAVACVSGFTPGTDWSPWALSCACIDWSCFKELSTDDSIESAWVERKRNWGSGRVELRASTRGLDQTALRRIMVARSILSKLQLRWCITTVWGRALCRLVVGAWSNFKMFEIGAIQARARTPRAGRLQMLPPT